MKETFSLLMLKRIGCWPCWFANTVLATVGLLLATLVICYHVKENTALAEAHATLATLDACLLHTTPVAVKSAPSTTPLQTFYTLFAGEPWILPDLRALQQENDITIEIDAIGTYAAFSTALHTLAAHHDKGAITHFAIEKLTSTTLNTPHPPLVKINATFIYKQGAMD